MVFSSLTFLYYFLSVMLIVYYLVPKKMKNAVLLAGSLFFYSWGKPAYLILMLVSLTLIYGLGLAIEKCKSVQYKKWLMVIAIMFPVALLMYYKYTGFFIHTMNGITGMHLNIAEIILPVGISFYTFQMLSYVIDVYRGDVPAQSNWIDFAVYIAMFPQLIAGPIVRYQDISGQITDRSISWEQAAYGCRRFVTGLCKKVIIANTLGLFCNQYQSASATTVVWTWCYAAAVILQIYFDFSGYSDMAVGLGCFFGFKLPENFRYPLMAESLTDFWRRWHMTLTRWFRDYVYIPIGGSRCSKGKLWRNVMIIWLLTGMWHGADWNYILWGVSLGLLLLVEKTWLQSWLKRIPAIFRHLYVIVVMLLSFLVFHENDLGMLVKIYGRMLPGFSVPFFDTLTAYYLKSYGILLVTAVIGATSLPSGLYRKISEQKCASKWIEIIETVVLVISLLVATAYLVDGSFNPFLYFRF